ncbi:MAG: DUF4352 domain-containing protein [Bacillota bacterium]|nr:DUF4352 domain-containing protein [Bacillota bacterium]
MRRALAVGALVAAMALAGCGSTETPKKVGTTATQPTSAGQTSQQQVFKVGDVIQLGQLQFVVNGVREDKGSQFLKPPAGKRWVVVDATVVNKSDQPAAISSLAMFQVKDADGRQYSITIGPDLNGHLDGELAAADRMRGEVAFEVPATAKGLQLVFHPNLLGFGQAIVALGE